VTESRRIQWLIVFGALLLLGLWAASLYDYLLFHGLAEMFGVVVSCGIFMIAWNSRHFTKDSFILFIGIAYLFVGFLDLIHTLAYKGMGVFQNYGPNLSTQLWIAARYVESVSLLIGPFLIGRKIKPGSILAAYTITTSLLLGSIFYWKIFPICFIDKTGLTNFKVVSEYVICFILLFSIMALIIKGQEYKRQVLGLLIASIALTIAAELAFTFYVDVYGFFNLLGHYFKIVSFYFIYRAIIETSLKQPYSSLFRDIKLSEEAVKAAKDNLEIEVEKQTAELKESMAKLSEAELRYRTIADFTFDWEYWEKPNKKFHYISPSCERITGYKVQEFIDNPKLIEEIIIEQDRKIWDEHRETATQESVSRDVQFRIRNKQGQTCWIEHVCQPVNDEKGNFLGFRASNRDITERKLAEESLRDSEAALKRSQESLRFLAGRLLTVQEEERRRLARDLHDDLSQRLAVLAIVAGKLEKQIGQNSSISDKLKQIKEHLVKLSTDVHDISRQLHPSIIDDLGLVDAMKSECSSFSKRESIFVTFDSKDVPSNIPPETAICIYRVLQESLRNIAKHAFTDEAQVTLIGTKNELVLYVKDPGIGFEPEKKHHKAGLGLASMQERIRLIQGKILIKSQTGKGTAIEARVPLLETENG
jgi:PAS domain S-box-containing protein